MKALILASAVGIVVGGLATAQGSAPGITSVEPGQTLCIRAYRLPGTPDLYLERQVTQKIEKQQVFRAVDKCGTADLALLLLGQYHNRYSSSPFKLDDDPSEYLGTVKAFLLPAEDFLRSYSASIPRDVFVSYTFDQAKISLAAFWQDQTGSKKVIWPNHHSKLAKQLHIWAAGQGVKPGSAKLAVAPPEEDPYEFEAGQWLYVEARRLSGQLDLPVQVNLQERFRGYPFFSVTCSPVSSQIGFLVFSEYHFKETHQSLTSKSKGEPPSPPTEFLYFETGYAIPVDEFLRHTSSALNLDALREAAVWSGQVGSERLLKRPENRSRKLAEQFQTHARYQETILASK